MFGFKAAKEPFTAYGPETVADVRRIVEGAAEQRKRDLAELFYRHGVVSGLCYAARTADWGSEPQRGSLIKLEEQLRCLQDDLRRYLDETA